MTIELLVNVNLEVDRLLSVRREIEKLKEDEETIKKELLAMKVDEIEGYHCKAVITTVADSKVADYKAVCAFLKISDDTINMFLKKKSGYSRIDLRPL